MEKQYCEQPILCVAAILALGLFVFCLRVRMCVHAADYGNGLKSLIYARKDFVYD